MTNGLDPEERLQLRYIIGEDRLRRLQGIKEDRGVYDESVIPAAIVENTQTLDLSKNLSELSKDLLEESAGIARSFTSATIEVTHLLYALIENTSVRERLEYDGFDLQKVKNVLDIRIAEGKVLNESLRDTHIELSIGVETVLKNALGYRFSEDVSKIEPFHIFKSLISSDYPLISSILEDAEVDMALLAENIQ